MIRFRSIIRVFLAAMMISLFFIPAYAANSVNWSNKTMPAACDNTSVNLISRASLTPVSNGYMRVFFDKKKIGIEYYDDSMNLTRSGSLDLELPIWGGFYSGRDGYYYIAEGQINTEENNSAEVIRIIRYDSNWNRVGAASITPNASLFGGEVRYPFDYGCGNMTEYNGKLYLVTGHEGYVDESVGQGHQGMLLVEVDKASMTGKIVDCDLWHSFAQYIKAGQDGLYILEQSEGSRYTKLSKFIPATKSTSASFSVLDYGGERTSSWAISCYASVDGLELSQTHALAVGTSIDQSNYDNVSSDTPHNIYLTVTPFSNFSKEGTTVRWLTSYTSGGNAFIGVHITKINNNRFMISWEEEAEDQQLADPADTLSFGKLKYMFVDGSGTQVSQIYSADAPISDCNPVVKDGYVVYYASNANMLNLYRINVNNGVLSKKAFRVAGPDATWAIENSVLTISGKGPVEIDPEAHPRYTVSSTSGWYSYSSSDNAWKLVRGSVTKINILKGITAISDNAFSHFNKLKDVDIADGLVSIGKEAFYACDSLESVHIPDSVTSIGDDILWTGASWVGSNSHVTYATVYGNCSSYAISYARKNSIRYESPHDFADSFTVDSEPTCDKEGSKSRHCRICGDKTDVTEIPANGHDYQLGKIVNGASDATCKVCGDHRTVNVPVSMSVFWRNETSDSAYYWSGPSILKMNEKMYIMIEGEFAGEDNQLNEFIVDTGDEQIRAFGHAVISFSKPGTYTVKIYSRYRPDISRIYEIGVADESGNVPEADESEKTPEANDEAQEAKTGKSLKKGASVKEAETAIAAMTSDNDLPGSVFNKLQLKSAKQTKTSITINWKKVAGAKKYVIYGNKCGKANKMKKLGTSTGKSRTYKRVLGKKVKKGTYYKFMVIALDKNNKIVSASKIIHVATKGGKVGNIGKITTKAKKNKVTVKKGKTFKLGAKQIAASKKLKVKTHRKLSYESSNTKIATVSKSGKIKGKKKGSCYVYVYAQNGVFKKIKITVK